MKKRKRSEVKAWLKVIERDRDWDWSYFAAIIAFKLDHMAVMFDSGHLVNSHKNAQLTRKCAKLFRKIEADRYRWGPTKDSIIAAEARKQRDLDAALKIISENLFSWWD